MLHHQQCYIITLRKSILHHQQCYHHPRTTENIHALSSTVLSHWITENMHASSSTVLSSHWITENMQCFIINNVIITQRTSMLYHQQCYHTGSLRTCNASSSSSTVLITLRTFMLYHQQCYHHPENMHASSTVLSSP